MYDTYIINKLYNIQNDKQIFFNSKFLRSIAFIWEESSVFSVYWFYN